MGDVFSPKVPDNSAQLKELDRQEKEAEKRAREEKKRLNQDMLALRQRRFGRQSLLRNEGGALGVRSSLGQTQSNKTQSTKKGGQS